MEGKINMFLLLLALFLGAISGARGQFSRDKEKQIKDQILGRNYDPSVVPAGVNGTGPVHVNVSFFVKNFLAVDPKSMTMQIQLLVSMKWHDPRMSFTPFPPSTAPDNITLDSSLVDRVWVPKLYFINALDRQMDKENQLLRVILAKGNMVYSYVTTVTVACPMNFRFYPHETSNCGVKFSSYSHTNSDVVFKWNEDLPAVIASDADMNLYTLSEFDTHNYTTQTPSGDYSCLELDLHFKRSAGYFLMQVYIPCSMLVITSYLSYFLHPTKAATPRLIVVIIALAVACLGCLFLNFQLPHISYTRAIDTFTGISLTFIFTSLVEFVFVSYMSNYGCGHCRKGHPEAKGDNPENAEQEVPLNQEADGKMASTTGEEDSAQGASCAAKVDIAFRILIPILFFSFLVLYFLAVVIFA